MKKICIATGTRAEYGLLKPVISKVYHADDMELVLLVTGMHLSPEFGLTYKEIEKDGFPIAAKIEMLLSADTSAGITKSVGVGLMGYADFFEVNKPDIVVILGDRYEMIGVALSAMIASSFSTEEVSPEEIENLKRSSEMDSLMSELAESMPAVKQVLIDERDQYIAAKIWEAKENSIIAVLGAGHLPGVEAWLKKAAAGQASADMEEISSVPKKSLFSKILIWLIPAAIIALIAYGFYIGGRETGTKLVLSWIMFNSILAGLGSAIAAAHPVTILVSAVGAPVTSLCPFIGVGFVAGAVQALICKPQVKDLENLTDDAGSVKGFYRNKLLKVLLVFFLSSIGSSIGTFAGGADILVKITALLKSIFGK